MYGPFHQCLGLTVYINANKCIIQVLFPVTTSHSPLNSCKGSSSRPLPRATPNSTSLTYLATDPLHSSLYFLKKKNFGGLFRFPSSWLYTIIFISLVIKFIFTIHKYEIKYRSQCSQRKKTRMLIKKNLHNRFNKDECLCVYLLRK